ncbi:hypothetical protein DSO57_1009113 [Entomophthora muscae]|uniref:Uncharacterized protein n=1 Tax=Entomophthora muscae TaxID=34485 RepID=A0ACC2RY78_9FUNG|nr:hypothetical protein DSO57_1009113 [Entomophthora muscae]
MYSSSFPGSPRGTTCQGSRTRIILCGGGVISAAISYYLTVLSKELKKSIEVIIVEKGAIACSSSGKAGGFLALDWCKGLPIDELAQKSFSLHADLAKTLNGAENYGYRRVETLEIYADDELEDGKNIELSEKSKLA